MPLYNNLTLIFVDVEHVGYITLELNVFGALAFIEGAALGCLKQSYHFSREL
jgi:hypothetical protein